ncbi:MAG: SIR2 family protein, partial [Waterburya sp.]
EKKRKIPSRILRFCQEQLYELIQSCEPESKMCVVDIETIGKKEDIEFVVGVGVASEKKKTIADIGYTAIKSVDIFYDLLHQNRNYEPKSILDSVTLGIGKNITYLPLFHYLHKLGIINNDLYKQSGLNLDKWLVKDIKKLQEQIYRGSFNTHCKNKNIAKIIQDYPPEKAAKYIPFISVINIDLDIMWQFLVENEGQYISSQSNYATSFRKIACLYDKLKYGW